MIHTHISLYHRWSNVTISGSPIKYVYACAGFSYHVSRFSFLIGRNMIPNWTFRAAMLIVWQRKSRKLNWYFGEICVKHCNICTVLICAYIINDISDTAFLGIAWILIKEVIQNILTSETCRIGRPIESQYINMSTQRSCLLDLPCDLPVQIIWSWMKKIR